MTVVHTMNPETNIPTYEEAAVARRQGMGRGPVPHVTLLALAGMMGAHSLYDPDVEMVVRAAKPVPETVPDWSRIGQDNRRKPKSSKRKSKDKRRNRIAKASKRRNR